ncbi:hypothetical protein [Kribbella sp. NPDC051620]|uniref:hypothetical protein n=1 Tax=Kribbella sp. NPDC051620 TaxID=3364120 RepID=UPI00379F1A5C
MSGIESADQAKGQKTMKNEDRGGGATRYRLLDRFRDSRAGRRDGKRDAAVPSYRSPHPEGQPTDWLAKNQHRLLAGCQYEFSAARLAVDELLVQLTRARTDAAQARNELADATIRWQGASDGPSPEILQRRGPAELQDSEHTIDARRRAEHRQQLARLESTCEAARAKAAVAEATAADLTTRIEQRFGQAVDRSRELLELHEQRAAQYRRSYCRALRLAEPAAEQDHPLSTTPPLRLPQWTAEPCPWLPVEQPEATSTITTVRSIR